MCSFVQNETPITVYREETKSEKEGYKDGKSVYKKILDIISFREEM